MTHPHHVFKLSFRDGVARSLNTAGMVKDPLSKKTISVENMVWDTGATNTCITPKVATDLGLTQIGVTTMHTANGSNLARTYLADVIISQTVTITNVQVSEANLGPNTDVLIGMDIIALGDFLIQNINGKTEFSFCIPPFETKYDMVEKANQINLRNHKANLKLMKKKT